MATEHHSWFKSALPEQHKALSEFIKSQAVNGDDFTVSMSEIAASAVFSSWVVTIVLIVLAFLGRGALNKATSRTNELERYEADSGFGLRNIFEMYVGFIFQQSLLATIENINFGTLHINFHKIHFFDTIFFNIGIKCN